MEAKEGSLFFEIGSALNMLTNAKYALVHDIFAESQNHGILGVADYFKMEPRARANDKFFLAETFNSGVDCSSVSLPCYSNIFGLKMQVP